MSLWQEFPKVNPKLQQAKHLISVIMSDVKNENLQHFKGWRLIYKNVMTPYISYLHIQKLWIKRISQKFGYYSSLTNLSGYKIQTGPFFFFFFPLITIIKIIHSVNLSYKWMNTQKSGCNLWTVLKLNTGW